MRFFRRAVAGLFLLSLTVALLGVAGGVVWSALQARWSEEPFQRPPRERIFTAEVVPIRIGTVTPVLTAFGEVASRRTLELRAPVEGTILELADSFEDGGAVDAGDLLLRVDPTSLAAALETARADLAQAEADLREAERSVDLAGEELTAAEGQADLQRRALERQRDLRDRGVGSAAAVEQAELTQASAAQAILSARQALATAEATADARTTALARARIAVSEAERAVAETALRADFAGILADVAATRGGLVSRNEQVATLIDPDALEVAFRVSTSQYARLLDADGRLIRAPATVTLDVFGSDISAPATLVREAGAVEAGLTGRLLYARLEETRGFRPGDFVTVAVEEPMLERVAVLPATALDAASRVLVLGEDDRLEEAEVTLLRRQGDDVLVRAADLVGREVVVTRSPVLGPGIRVNPIRPEAGDAPAPPQTVALTPERRARLIAFVEQNGRMPAEVRDRLLQQLNEDQVPSDMVARLESRMGS